MKILQVGNTANIGYLTTKQLRKDGIDVDLLLDPSGTFPSKSDPSLKNGYPEWCIFYHRKKYFWKLKIIKTMRKKKYDLIHAYAETPIFAFLSGKKYIVQALGSDTRELALSNSIRGILLRMAYKKAKVILFAMPDLLPIYSKFGLKNCIFFPLMVDSSFYKPKKFMDNEYHEKFVVFHPTNLIWRHKRNDILLKGFAKFVETNPKSILIIIDNGEDSEKTHQLVRSLGLNEKVKFIDGPLNSSELLHYYNLADVVADSFLFPAMSGITNEALCCEKPVITYCPPSTWEGFYPESPPILNSSTEDEVFQNLELLKDDKKRLEIGKKSREWITKYNDPYVYCTKFRSVYESVINGDNLGQIRDKLDKITLMRGLNDT